MFFAGDTSQIGGAILNNSVATFCQENDSAFNNLISGSGIIKKQNKGSFTLSGNNLYRGDTLIEEGSLILTGDTSKLKGNIINHGILSFNQSKNSSFENMISGPGSVEKSGAGVLTLNEKNIHNGTTYVNNGTIKAGKEGSFSPYSPVVIANEPNAVLDLNGIDQTIASLSGGGNAGGQVIIGEKTLTLGDAADTTFLGAIIGNGFLKKQGSGTFHLIGEIPFKGTIHVLEGNVILNGSSNGHAIVDNGAAFIGNGVIRGNLTTLKGSIISPGNSIGTIVVVGDYTNHGGNYELEINSSGRSDLMNVTGTATLNGGNVIISSIDGAYSLNKPYTILRASNILGTYDGAMTEDISQDQSLLRPTLSYDPEHTYLTIETAIHRAAETKNQCAVAYQLDGITHPNDQQTILLNKIVNLSMDDARLALDSLSGEQHTDDTLMTSLVNRQFIRRLYDPLRPTITQEPRGCENNFNVWTEGSAGYTSVNNTKNAAGFNANGYEMTVGAEGRFRSDWTIGAAGSYEYNQFRYKEEGRGKSKTWLIGLYGLYRPYGYYGLVDLAYGNSANTMIRPIVTGPFEYEVHSTPKISQFTFYGELGIDWSIKCFLIQPFIGIESGSYSRQQVVEKSTMDHVQGWELAINQKDKTNVYSRLGVHLTPNELPYSFSLSIDIAWVRRLTANDNNINARFVEFGSDFAIEGVPLDNNGFDGSITLSTRLFDVLRIYVEGSGEVWNRAKTYNVVGGIELNW